MRENWKMLLEPFGIMFGGMTADLDDKSLDELRELLEACHKTTTTNCWCYAYEAAQYLKPILAQRIGGLEQREKRFAAEK